MAATHGLVGGEIASLAEPALALTIPKEPTELDNGLLTTSEVAQLKLNADWVILSACNTAAGDKPGAEALSGLARAFFYARARALLVSHWQVDSDSAVRLTTSTFDALKKDPAIGRAEATHGSQPPTRASIDRSRLCARKCATQKRQGTKSRDVGRWRYSRLYGDLYERRRLRRYCILMGSFS